MRIVAGQKKGRKLKSPKGRDVRPTLDRVREALFSSLGGHVKGARVLDLFAGTGALGLEALSRGAMEAVFIDKSREVRRVLKENISDLGFEAESSVIGGDGIVALKEFGESGRSFDLVFMDPPYASRLLEKALSLFGEGELLAPDGVIVAEHAKGAEFDLPKSLHLERTRSYGGIALATIVRRGARAPKNEEKLSI